MTRQTHHLSIAWAAATGIVADGSRPMTRQTHHLSIAWAAATGVVADGADR